MNIYRSESRFQLTTTGTKTRGGEFCLGHRSRGIDGSRGMTSMTFSVCTCRVGRGQGSIAAPVKLAST